MFEALETLFDILGAILKGVGKLFRFILEAGIWEVFSIQKPGRAILKIIWPPFWFKAMPSSDTSDSILAIATFLGVVFWLLLAVTLIYYSQVIAFLQALFTVK